MIKKLAEIFADGNDPARFRLCSAFLAFTEPLNGWRTVSVSERRTKKDWAGYIADWLEVHYSRAPKVGPCYGQFEHTYFFIALWSLPPDRAGTLAKRLKIYYTPKHGS